MTRLWGTEQRTVTIPFINNLKPSDFVHIIFEIQIVTHRKNDVSLLHRVKA